MSLLALPHGHVYSHSCNQLDVDWAIWLKPEPIAGKKCLLVHVRAVAVAYWRIPVVYNLVSVSNPGILPPALSREDCLHIIVGVTSNISGYRLSAV